MTTQSTKKTLWDTWGNLLVPIVIALIFFALLFFFYPFRGKIQFDGDEGLNLMRSMLVAMGHPLYTQVSSDQPPLFNVLLALLFRVTGFNATPARVFVLLFSTLLVWAAAQILQLTWGKTAAVVFLPLAMMAPKYLVLSVSVMIGVPCVAMAVVSMLFMVLWHKQRREAWLVLSGFALALSVLIKLFGGMLAPIFVAGICAEIYFEEKDKRLAWKKMLRPVLIWGLCFGGLTLALGLMLVGPQNVWDIIYPHLMAPTEKSSHAPGYTIYYQLQDAVPLMALAVFGVAALLYRRKWLTLYPLAWAALAYTLFSFYAPVFYHHQLLVTIPLAMAAAGGIAEGLVLLAGVRKPGELRRLPALVSVVALISFVLVSVHYYPVVKPQLANKPQIGGASLSATAGKMKVINTMNQYIAQTHWIMTDMPMYAFLVHKPVPPVVATFSSKRLASGSLTGDDILTAMQQYHPEQVLMGRFVIPKLETYLRANYTLVADPEFFRLFVRNDIVKQGKK